MLHTPAYLSQPEIQSIFKKTRATFPVTPSNTAKIPTILAEPRKRMEHTLLKIDADHEEIVQLCRTAAEYQFRGVCCLPRHIPTCKSLLKGTDVLIVSVVDFPLCGASPRDVAYLAHSAIKDGAHEIDMVLDVAALKDKKLNDVHHRILMVTALSPKTPVKVILETACLTEEETVIACAICQAAGAAFVKTSTGFASRGASVRDIEIIKTAVADTMCIKASGGIKDAPFAQQLMDAGADVIGTSSGPKCI